MSARRQWADEATVPIQGIVPPYTASSPCRVCGALVVPGDGYLHLIWASERAHQRCGWLTRGEREALTTISSGRYPDVVAARAMVPRGYVRMRPHTMSDGAVVNAFAITDSGRRALERGW